MKASLKYLLPALAVAAVTPSAWAEKEITIRRLDQDAPHHGMPMRDDDDDRMVDRKSVV